MITAGYLKKELAKVPDDALVYAYEGEVSGVIICAANKPMKAVVIIHADERHELQDDWKPDVYGGF